MATKQLTEAFDKLEAKYKTVLKLCYDALKEEATQEQRDAIREAIEPYIEESGSEEE